MRQSDSQHPCPLPPAPLASIAIPFYNPGPSLEWALKSVFAQTFEDWELLLLDDGGSDGSLERVRCLNDPRVRVFSDGTNKLLARRLNELAGLARGRFLFRMDADDLSHPRRLEEQLDVLHGAPANVVLGTSAYSIDKESRVIGLRPALTGVRTGFAARHSFIHPTVAASTAWFRENAYSEEYAFRRSEDSELWCRTVASSDFRWLERPLYFYREVGVFKLRNYLSTAEGQLHLIGRTESGSLKRFLLASAERSKMGIAWALDAVGASDFMVKRRTTTLQADELASANEIVQRIARTPLPTRPMTDDGS